MDFTILPSVNAVLNSISAVLITAGFVMVRQKKVAAHKRFMLAAVATSALFLVSYLVHKFSVGPTRFQGEGLVRTVYFVVLISHTILAAAVVPLVIITVLAGLRERIERHRRIARWTLPIWLYVSVTGVVVYWMLYHADFS